MEVISNLWLCQDCMIAAVNGDYTGLDYYLPEDQATARMELIQRELAKLPGLVADFGGEDPEHVECRDCDWSGPNEDLKTLIEEDGTCYWVCPECNSDDWRKKEWDNGEEEFSRRDCDCCGDDLAGSRFRFAQLVKEAPKA